MKSNILINAGKYTLEVVDKNGNITDKVEGTNLILNNFLNKFSTNKMFDIIPEAYAGSGKPSPTSEMYTFSGAVTASQSGTTVTSSGAFFTAGMVGDTIHFEGDVDGNDDCTITAYTSSTQVTVNTSKTVSSDQFAVWDTDRTSLFTHEAGLTFDFRQVDTTTDISTLNPPTFAGETTFKYYFDRRPISPPSTITINEIGLGSAANDLGVMFFLDSDVDVIENSRLILTYTISYGLEGITEGVATTTDTVIAGANDTGSPTITHQLENTNIAPQGLPNLLQPSYWESDPSVGGGYRGLFTDDGTSTQLSSMKNFTYSSTTEHLNSTVPQSWYREINFNLTNTTYDFNRLILADAGSSFFSRQDYYLYSVGVTNSAVNIEDTLDITITMSWNRRLPANASL